MLSLYSSEYIFVLGLKSPHSLFFLREILGLELMRFKTNFYCSDGEFLEQAI